MSFLLDSIFAWIVFETALSAALLGFYLVVKRFISSPRERYLILKVLLFSLPFLPLIPVPMQRLRQPSVAPQIEQRSKGQSPDVGSKLASATTSSSLDPLVVAKAGGLSLYAFFALAFLGRLAINHARLRALIRTAEPMTVYNGIPVLCADSPLPPATVGVLRPVILVPRVLANLPATKMQMVFRHEERHVEAYDYLFNFLRALVQAALIFSPFAHLLCKHFMMEMELACDAVVLTDSSVVAKDYGRLLLDLATGNSHRAKVFSGGLYVSQTFISRRIMSMKLPQTSFRPARAILISVFAAGIAATAASAAGSQEAIELGQQANDSVQFLYELQVETAEYGQSFESSGRMTLDNETAGSIEISNFLVEIRPAVSEPQIKFDVVLRDKKSGEALYNGSAYGSEATIKVKDLVTSNGSKLAFQLALKTFPN